MGKQAFLLPIPPCVLELTAALLGKRTVAQRQDDSLQVNIDKTRRLLGLTLPLSLVHGLRVTVRV
jgi:hypothetical protein